MDARWHRRCRRAGSRCRRRAHRAPADSRARLTIDEVLPGLFIGAAPSPRECRRLERHGVCRVLDLRSDAEVTTPRWRPSITVARHPVIDGAGMPPGELALVAATIDGWLARADKVFIHCQGGIGRTAMVACGLLLRRGYSLADAYRLVRESRPFIAPTEAQVKSLMAYEAALRSHDPTATPVAQQAEAVEPAGT